MWTSDDDAEPAYKYDLLSASNALTSQSTDLDDQDDDGVRGDELEEDGLMTEEKEFSITTEPSGLKQLLP